MLRVLSVIAASSCFVSFPLTASPAAAAAPAGNAISITVGYLGAWKEHNNFFVEGSSTTFASDNKFLGAMAEGPALWKSIYPVVAAKWLIDNRYDTNLYENHLSTSGVLVCGGLGYGFRAWQSTLRIHAAVGYWWETVDVDFTGLSGGGAFKINNDDTTFLLGASLAFPFANRVNALMSCEFVARGESTYSGSFESGRDYRLETNGEFSTVSIGLLVQLTAR